MVSSCSLTLEQLGRLVSFLFVGCFVLFAETELNESLATSLKDSLVLLNVLGDYVFCSHPVTSVSSGSMSVTSS